MKTQQTDIVEEIRKYNSLRGFALPKGESYAKRVKIANEIYDAHARDGVSNRHIWRMYVHPLLGVSERTFYNYLKRADIE